jgi:hypothetical protein
MGFQGGIREFIARSEFETEETIADNQNRIQNYNIDVKGYYRFAGQDPRSFTTE